MSKPLLHWDQTVEPFWSELSVDEKADLLGGIVDESDNLDDVWYGLTNQEKLDIFNNYHGSQYTLWSFAETREE